MKKKDLAIFSLDAWYHATSIVGYRSDVSSCHTYRNVAFLRMHQRFWRGDSHIQTPYAANYIQWGPDYCIPSNFLIYVLVCTAQTPKSMKANDIPLKSLIKLQQEMQKKFWIFQNFVRFLGHFLKKQWFWKMGMAGIKELPHPYTMASFSGNLKGQVLLKVSFKNIDFFY